MSDEWDIGVYDNIAKGNTTSGPSDFNAGDSVGAKPPSPVPEGRGGGIKVQVQGIEGYDNVAHAREFGGVAYELELKDAPDATAAAPAPLALWDAGDMSKPEVQDAVLAGPPGCFMVRKMTGKPDRVLVANDGGKILNIRIPMDNIKFGGKQLRTVDQLINAMSNTPGALKGTNGRFSLGIPAPKPAGLSSGLAAMSVGGGGARAVPPPLPADDDDAPAPAATSAPASIKGRASVHGAPRLKSNSQTQRKPPSGGQVKGRARVLGGESGGIDSSFKA